MRLKATNQTQTATSVTQQPAPVWTSSKAREADEAAAAEAAAAPPPLPKFTDLLDRIGPSMKWDGHDLPVWTSDAVDWPSPDWLRYMVWQVSDMEFRHELFAFDLAVRQAHPDIPAYQDSLLSRWGTVSKVWGGGGVRPKPDGEGNPLCSPDLSTRLRALADFRELMRAWPRSADFLPVWREAEERLGHAVTVSVLDEDQVDLPSLERDIWTCYAQVHYDYRHEFPPLPFEQPPLPFALSVDSSVSV